MAANGSDTGASFTVLIQRAASAAAALASAPPPPPPGRGAEAAATRDPAVDVLAQLEHLRALADSLSLISPNETLRDISTPALRALFLPSLTAEVLTRIRHAPPPSASPQDPFAKRKEALKKASAQARTFLATVTRLNILPPSTLSLLGARNELQAASASASGQGGNSTEDEERPTFSSSSSATPASISASSAAQARQLKIALFKLERSLTASLDAYRSQARAAAAARRRTGVRAPAAGVSTTSGGDLGSEPEEAFYDLLVLGHDAAPDADKDTEDHGEDEEDEDDANAAVPSSSLAPSSGQTPTSPTSLRSYLLLNLNLHALKAYALLGSASQELTLLANMPSPSSMAQRGCGGGDTRAGTTGRGQETDSTWRLDTALGGGSTSGPLLDPKGRPLRPFTITPSTGSASSAHPTAAMDPTAKRAALKAQVFQPSHRLPTMSIDDYLAEEERRGNVLRGGGPEGAAKPTPKEERAIRAELDGTREGDEAEKEERAEKIKWDAWADEHRRGEGNTMNRG